MTSSTHEPADCELAACDRCDSYGDGYSAGKDAAHFADPHCGSSGLTPQTAAAGRARRSGRSVRKVLQAAGEPVLLPDRHLEDCAGPGCGASCGCWRHAR